MIKPTIGRVVWLWPSDELQANPDLRIAYRDKTVPLAATVAYVWSDRMVNLSAVDQNGKPFGLTRVTLLQGDETYNPMGNYCEWMPYQKGQAAKVETPDFVVSGLLKAETQIVADIAQALEAANSAAPVTAVTDDMVSRFLGWALPQDFNPDCFVSFDREKAKSSASFPTGTNLLDAIQARAMLEHVIVAKPLGAVEFDRVNGEPINLRSTPVEPSLSPFDFGGALNVMRLGGRVARKGWNGKGMWLGLHTETGTFTREECGTELEYAPYVVMKTADNKLVPWLCSQTDMLATDWQAL